MGYELHITRKANWVDKEGPEITTEEWASVVAADPELEMVGVAHAKIDGEVVLTYTHEWLAQMVTHPRLEEHGAWIDWTDGSIDVKNPDEVLIAKMCEIARKLGARVQGDEGEYYDE